MKSGERDRSMCESGNVRRAKTGATSGRKWELMVGDNGNALLWG
jgi:hypothetical protein